MHVCELLTTTLQPIREAPSPAKVASSKASPSPSPRASNLWANEAFQRRVKSGLAWVSGRGNMRFGKTIACNGCDSTTDTDTPRL